MNESGVWSQEAAIIVFQPCTSIPYQADRRVGPTLRQHHTRGSQVLCGFAEREGHSFQLSRGCHGMYEVFEMWIAKEWSL